MKREQFIKLITKIKEDLTGRLNLHTVSQPHNSILELISYIEEIVNNIESSYDEAYALIEEQFNSIISPSAEQDSVLSKRKKRTPEQVKPLNIKSFQEGIILLIKKKIENTISYKAKPNENIIEHFRKELLQALNHYPTVIYDKKLIDDTLKELAEKVKNILAQILIYNNENQILQELDRSNNAAIPFMQESAPAQNNNEAPASSTKDYAEQPRTDSADEIDFDAIAALSALRDQPIPQLGLYHEESTEKKLLKSKLRKKLNDLRDNKVKAIKENLAKFFKGEEWKNNFIKEFKAQAEKIRNQLLEEDFNESDHKDLMKQISTEFYIIVGKLLIESGYKDKKFENSKLFPAAIKAATDSSPLFDISLSPILGSVNSLDSSPGSDLSGISDSESNSDSRSVISLSDRSDLSAIPYENLSIPTTRRSVLDFLAEILPIAISRIEKHYLYRATPLAYVVETFGHQVLDLANFYPILDIEDPALFSEIERELRNNISFLHRKTLDILLEKTLLFRWNPSIMINPRYDEFLTTSLDFRVSVALGFNPEEYFPGYIYSNAYPDSHISSSSISYSSSSAQNNNAAIDSQANVESKVVTTKLEKTADNNILKPESFSDILAKIAEFVELHFQYVFTQSEENSQFTCNSAFGKKEIAMEVINIEENKNSLTEGKIISLSPLFETSVKAGNEEINNPEYFEFTPEEKTYNNLEKYAAAGAEIAVLGLFCSYTSGINFYAGTTHSGETTL